VKSLAALILASAPLFPGMTNGADDPKPQTLDSNGVSISYTVEGKGEPVVLIHGLYASAQVNWRAPGVIRILATNHQVIALDVRGHAASGKPTQEADYGVEMAEDIVRLLDHLKIPKTHIVGYSMGGMITMKLLTRHPDRVKSALLGGMGWLREGSPLQKSWSRMRDRPGSVPPSVCIRSLGALAVTEEEVKAIKVPVAVIIGENDPIRRLYVEPLERIRTDWPVTLVPAAGHLDCILMPEFKQGIKKWLEEQAGQGAKGEKEGVK
jgi:pimeloyl-ACP methyl ester carboxylesterase